MSKQQASENDQPFDINDEPDDETSSNPPGRGDTEGSPFDINGPAED